MSSSVPIGGDPSGTAPTPVNTPLNAAPISSGLSRPTVPDIKEDKEGEDDDDEEDISGDAAQSAMAGLIQGRLASLVGKSSGYIENLPVEIKRNVEGLKGVQVKQTALHNKYKREALELEKKYLELQKPHYERRRQIISGEAIPSTDEVADGEKETAQDEEDYTPLPKDIPESKDGIPEFWLTALRNHIGISELVTDRDAEALKSLTDIRIEYLDDSKPEQNPGFKLIFTFAPNDFFENKVLEKTYIYQAEVGYSGDFVYDKAIGTEIKWKEEKDLTKEYEIKKQRNKNTNRTRLVRKSKPTESFFNFFNPPVAPSDEAIENGDVEEDELDEIEEKLEMDYQIGEDIKEKIIPRAIDYFTGKALEWEDADDDEDYSDEEDDDDEDLSDVSSRS